MRYFHPKSITWWTGILSVAMGTAMIAMPGYNLGEAATVLSVLSGGQNASPSGMILMGLGLIGIRDKLERG